MSSTSTPPEEEALPLLSAPREGVPEVVATPDALADVARALAAGTGPTAVDAERASGFRYGQRAFLVQLRRAGAGTVLVDSEALGELHLLAEALNGSEWVLHSATQDLPCLADRGMRPETLFDTEYAARLLGWERFGLGAVVARTLGVRLAKEHSAADWSTRPLPAAWLSYAALDVELLIAVREILGTELERAGKSAWAQEEFAHLAGFTPTLHAEPWRRVSGVGRLRSRRQLAIARELWQTRDTLARETDTAPGRLLADRVLLGIASQPPQSSTELQRHPALRRPLPMAQAKRWYAAVRRANGLPESALPSRGTGERQGRRQSPEERELLKERLAALKGALREHAAELRMGPEILLSPAIVKALASEPPAPEPEAVAAVLKEHGARSWQVEQTAAILATVLDST